MTNLKRILAMMLILAMACASVPAFSEGEQESAAAELVIEIYQEAEPTEEPTQEPTVEPTEEPTEEPTSEPTEEPTAEPTEEPTSEPTVEPTQEPTQEPSSEPTAEPTQAPGADLLPEFSVGYARVQAESFLYDGASPAAEKLYYTAGGIVYADERKSASDCDRIRVHFGGSEAALSAWADARDLVPLSADEAAAHIAGAQAAFFYGDDPALPLAALDYSSVINVPSGPDEDETAPAMLVEQTSLTLGQKQSAVLRVSFSDGKTHAVSFESEDQKIATVNAEGKVTGKTRGSTAILVTGEYGNSIRVPVTVKKAPTSLKLSAERKTLGVGDGTALTAELSKNTMGSVSYESSREDVARVDENGNVLALAPGKTTIKASTHNGKTAKLTITVKPAPGFLRFAAQSIIMGVDEVRSLTPDMDEGSAARLSWTSSDPSVVAVDEHSGEMHALSTGTAVITAAAHNSLTAELAVEVKNAPKFASLDASSISIGVNETVDLPVLDLGDEQDNCGGGYKLKSGDKKIASVTADGRITGKKVGQTTITLTTYNGHKAKLTVKVKKAPSKVTFDRSELCLGAGEEFFLSADLPGGSAGAIRLTSSDESIAIINETGSIIGRVPGSCIITAETYNGKKAQCAVTVKNAPERVALEDMILGVGQKAGAAALLNEGSAGHCSYYSFSDLLEVDEATGMITALKRGEATLYAETYNGLKTQCTVTVKNAPSRIAFDVKSITIGKGETVAVPGVILGEDGEDCAGSYTLKSEKSKIAKLSGGSITGKEIGITTITAKTQNGKKASLKVTVKKAPSKVTLSEEALILGLGETHPLSAARSGGSAGAITITSDNGAVAAMNDQGEIAALGLGECTITAEAFNGKADTCKITVLPAPETIRMDRDTLVLGVGEKLRPRVVLPEGTAGSCSFSIEDTAVASLTKDGYIKAKAKGETTLTAACFNGASARMTISVAAAPKKVKLPESKLTLSKNDTYQLGVPTITAEDAACSSFSYKSSSKKIATVSSTGLITAKKKGSCIITISTYNGKTDTVKLTVKEPPKSISFAETPAPLLVDDVYTPKIKFSNKATGNYTLTSSDESVARITEDGLSILAISGGQSIITATSYNGVTAEMPLSVLYLPDSVALKPASVTLGAGDTAQLSPVFPSGQGSHVTYTTSDASIASADKNGLIHTFAAGSAEITVHTKNGKTARCAVTVLQAPSRVELSPRTVRRSLAEGGVQLKHSFGASGEGGRVVYESSDESIATVDSTGYVRFVKAGSVVITATSYNNRRGFSDIEIGATPSAMAFAAGNVSVALGDSAVIPVNFVNGCESYRLSTSDANIAVADGDRVTGLQEGSCTLYAESLSGMKAECTLSVVSAPTGIDLLEDAFEMKLNVTPPVKLTANVQPAGVGSVSYTSTNPDVAAVDIVTGEVRATGLGSCEIIAETYDGKYSDRCTVTVSHLLEGVKIGIDPGHQRHANLQHEAVSPTGGGSKPKVSSGTHGVVTGAKEYVINLKVGLQLRDALESLGAEVYMTRETHDVDISNKQRAKMMNALGVDLVLRLHCNAADVSSARGISVVSRKTGTGKKEAARAAKAVIKHMLKTTGAHKRGLGTSDKYTGLNWSTVPSLLVEMGFMTNSDEDRKLSKPEYQQKLVRGMINGICEFMGRDLAYPYD